MIDPMSIDCPAITCRAKAFMRCTTSTDKVRTSMHTLRYLASLDGPLVNCPKGACEDCNWSTWIEANKLVKDCGHSAEVRPSFDKVVRALSDLKSNSDEDKYFNLGIDAAIHRVAQEYNLASTSEGLVQELRKLGNEYGARGVAEAAAELTDKKILINHWTNNISNDKSPQEESSVTARGGWCAPTDAVYEPETPTYHPGCAPDMAVVINSPVADPAEIANEIIDRAIQIRENYIAMRDDIRKHL